jgi:soluble lytic murein transglycosylase-like protein
MISWWIGIFLLCALLTGCGGKKAKVAPPPPPPQDYAQEEAIPDQEEPLMEQLSEKRLEELLDKSGLQREDAALEAELKKWDQALKIDMPVAINKQVKAYLVYFSTERKGGIKKYLARSTRYLPMIREVFQEYGLPEDLAYLAMIESGFNPYAYSHAHAGGMWQFIQGTGRRYGLAINNYVDERRDPVKATHAAAKYLTDLYKQFGSWYLAAASYNCGEGRVQREIQSSNHKNFWELSDNQRLPTETKNYVPQMIAATIIAKNPKKFGFTKIAYLPPLEYETVKVTEPTSLRAASLACNVPAEEIEMLNPELRRGMTPPDQPHYVLNIPKKSKEMFARHIQHARIEAPAVASARVQTASISSRRSYPKKETGSVSQKSSSSREVKSSRRTGKAASRTAKSTSNRSTHKTQTAKGKSKSNKASAQEVQVGSILGGGKSSLAARNSRAAGQGKASPKGSSAAAKKSTKKETRKKSSPQSSLKTPKTKTTARSGSSSKASSKASSAAVSTKNSKTRKKTPAVRTAASPRPDSS